MKRQLTFGQVSILQNLRDGENPLLRASDLELIFFDHDMAQLAHLGYILKSGNVYALTLEGLDTLARHENSAPQFVEHPECIAHGSGSVQPVGRRLADQAEDDCRHRDRRAVDGVVPAQARPQRGLP